LLTGSPSHCGREQDNPFEEADDFYRDRWSHDKVVRSTHGVNCTGSCIRYTSGALRLLARTHGVLLSVGRTGVCWDNAMAESFFATFKNELIYRHPWGQTLPLAARLGDLAVTFRGAGAGRHRRAGPADAGWLSWVTAISGRHRRATG
jgi:transposase InsO family protein